MIAFEVEVIFKSVFVLELNANGELVIYPSPEEEEKLLTGIIEVDIDPLDGESSCEEKIIDEEG